MSPLLIPFTYLSHGPGDFIAYLVQLHHFVILGQGLSMDKALASPSKLVPWPTLDPGHRDGTQGQMVFGLCVSAGSPIL